MDQDIANRSVAQLNRRLGDMLGTVRGGMLPRYAWKWAPDLPFFRSRLGKVWVLCVYQIPTMSRQEWLEKVGSEAPYQSNGMYSARPETSLPYGVPPTPEATQFYIRTIGEQMDQKLRDITAKLQENSDKRQEKQRIEWNEYTQDSLPAFENWTPGSRAGNVSFGGTRNL
jgi:hypothetical protein